MTSRTDVPHGPITAHTPALRLLMAIVDEDGDAGAARHLAPEARRHCAGVVRLAHRELEVHARDVGYEPRAWRQEALTNASACVATWRRHADEHEASPGDLELDRASWGLAAAIAAVPGDRMAVPGYLATAQGAWLSAYMRARRCVSA